VSIGQNKLLRRRQLYIRIRLPEIADELSRLRDERQNLPRNSAISSPALRNKVFDRRAYIVERIFDLRQEEKRLTDEQLLRRDNAVKSGSYTA
jgi:hypothetical protein